MKLIAVLALVLLATGCTLIPQDGAELDTMRVTSEAGFIYRPLVSGVDDWEVQPGAKEVLDFSSGHDQYGRNTGLLDDERWTIYEVIAQLDELIQEDTIFWPKKFARNVCGWFPGYSGNIEGISQRPYLLVPFSVQPDPHVDYPWDSCAPRTVPDIVEQMATITASARAEWIEVEFELPERSGGHYTLDLPGYTPTSSNVLTVRLDSPQTITASWTDGTREESWVFVVPIDWFWVNGSWEIPVGPSGVC